jgi:hypothetical protein
LRLYYWRHGDRGNGWVASKEEAAEELNSGDWELVEDV